MLKTILSLIVIITFIWVVPMNAQLKNNFLEKRLIVKTNLLNLFTGKPSVSVEHFFSKSFSGELSFVQGRVNDFLFTDTYTYNGWLLRAKKYLAPVTYKQLNVYTGLYIGNLKRVIQSSGWVDNSGWFGYPGKDFAANSIRGGASMGLVFITSNRIIIDGMGSLGFGKYTTYYKADRNAKTYLDAQI